MERLRRLRERWYQSPGYLSRPVAELEERLGFDDEWVRHTLALQHRRPTEVKDAVWGMVALDPESRVLLDWPVLQRLRFVRQLGLSYLVYPTAEHSRFTHSVGVYHATLQLLDHAARPEERPPGTADPHEVAILPRDRADVLHAALLHDLGHLPFSHATEQAFQSHRELATCGGVPVARFLAEAEYVLQISRGLAELLSAALILSPRFSRLYGALRGEAEGEASLRLAALVLGLPAHPGWPGIAAMISGQVDADKIDYLRRDSLHCNVPIGLDPSRLFLRTSLLRMDRGTPRPDQSPREAAEVHFAVNSSGTDAIEEITEARVRMYRRVYQHRVTLANEATLSAGLAAAVRADPVAFDAISLLRLGDHGLLRALDDATPSRPWARRLLLRRPLKRAAAFGNLVADDLTWLQETLPALSNTTLEELRAAATGKEFSDLRMDRKGRTPAGVSDFQRRIEAELDRIRALPGLGSRLPADAGPPDVIVLPIPRAPEPGGADPYVRFPDGRVSLASQTSTQIQRILAGHLYDALGYVVCAREWRAFTHFAVLRALHGAGPAPLTPHRLSFTSAAAPGPTAPADRAPPPAPPSELTIHVEERWRVSPERVVSRCRLPGAQLANLRVALEGAGWFDDCPAAAGPVDELPDGLGALCEFRGDGGWRVTPALMRTWLSQFPPSLRGSAGELLLAIVFLDAGRTAQLLAQARGELNHPGAVHAAPFGRGSGPAVRQRTLRGSTTWLPPGAVDHASLPAALDHAQPGDTLLLYDDWTLSGSQAVAQWLAWEGAPREAWPEALRDERELDDVALSIDQRGKLGRCHVRHVFALGEAAGAHRIREHLGGKGLVGTVDVSFGAPAPRVDWERFAELRSFLTEVGEHTLSWCRRGDGDGDPEGPTHPSPPRPPTEDALGYAGAAHLCVSPTNCPSSALTALWCPGTTPRGPWVPLFLRQRYLRHLVL